MENRMKLALPLILSLFAAMAGLALTGCGSKPTRIEAEVVAAGDVNPDGAGRPSPLLVRIYELKATGSFEGADFFSLYDQDSAVLGADLLAREELQMRPGTQSAVARVADPDAQFLGVLGAYRAIDQVRWRATYPLRQGETNALRIRLEAGAVSVEEQ
jgi:type VI secretion system protein VasD